METEKMETGKWIEVFSQGDIWELEEVNGNLRAYLTRNESEDYDDDELCDNGISNVSERARMMRLKLVQIDYNGNPID